MTTRLTGYGPVTLGANDTYVLAGIDPQGKWTKAVVSIKRNASYDGSITVGSRPVGSSAAFVTQSYTTKAGAVSSAALTTGDDQIDIDATGKEIALIVTGQTQGTATVYLGVQNEA